MSNKNLHKKAIALLITVFFIMAITISLGVGLKYINSSKKSIADEQFTMQSSLLIEDILNIFRSSQELSKIKTSQDLALFLASSSVIPFKSNGVKVLIELSSARSKINPNVLLDKARNNAFKRFLSNNMVNSAYADMLADAMSGIKEDMSYNTDIFNKNPYLFRSYITSFEHLDEINEIYKKEFHDNSLDKFDMKNLFYIMNDKNIVLDLNYANSSAWQIMLGCTKERADMLSLNAGAYEKLDDLELNNEEKLSLSKFKTSFFQLFLDVKIKISQNKKESNIRFEYDIKSKKGYNFVFKV